VHDKSCNRLLVDFEFTFLCSVGKLLFAFISALAYNALCRMSPELLKLPLRDSPESDSLTILLGLCAFDTALQLQWPWV
jgi:hypothetical protein